MLKGRNRNRIPLGIARPIDMNLFERPILSLCESRGSSDFVQFIDAVQIRLSGVMESGDWGLRG